MTYDKGTRGLSPWWDKWEALFDQLNSDIPGLQSAIQDAAATSTTSRTVGTGSQQFTLVPSTRLYTVGDIMRIENTPTPANFMVGDVTAASAGSVTVNVTQIGGSGTLAAWTIQRAITGVLPAQATHKNHTLKSDATSASWMSLSAILTKSGAYTVVEADQGKTIVCTAALTLTLTAAATVGTDWFFTVRNASTGRVLVDPASTETMDGTASGMLRLGPGESALVVTDGTGWRSVGAPALPRGFIDGLTISNGTDTVNDIDVTVGCARDSTDVSNIRLLAALTGKQLDAAWAAGSAAGMRDTGAIADGTWHIFLIESITTGAVDILASLSATAPTTPATHPLFRRIGSIIRLTTILGFKQIGNLFQLNLPVRDVSTTNPGTAAVTPTFASLPAGIVVEADIAIQLENSTTAQIYGLVTALTQIDTAPSVTVHNFYGGDQAVIGNTTRHRVATDTSRRVRYRISLSGAADDIRIFVQGWIDQRGKDA